MTSMAISARLSEVRYSRAVGWTCTKDRVVKELFMFAKLFFSFREISELMIDEDHRLPVVANSST